MKLNRPTHRRDYRQAISNITINNYLRNMKVFFAWMVDTDCIVLSPMKKIHPLPQERKPKEYLEDEEVKALLRAMDRSYFPEYRDLIVMMIMLDAGTRLGETLSATMEQLNVPRRACICPRTRPRADATGRCFSPRRLPRSCADGFSTRTGIAIQGSCSR